MTYNNTNTKNAKVIREYIFFLKNARRRSEKTIDTVCRAISSYLTHINQADFSTFNKFKAVQYKDWLQTPTKGKELSLTTVYTYCRCLSKFFIWLHEKSGYKSKYSLTDCEYFSFTQSEYTKVTQIVGDNYPDFSYIQFLVKSIDVKNEIDFRDSALISFLALSGIRVGALISLSMQCLDSEKLIIYQNPALGVKTKFSKSIISVLHNLDSNMIDIIQKWKNHLQKRGFSNIDPLFPASKANLAPNDYYFRQPEEIETVFWQSSGPVNVMIRRRAAQAKLPYFSAHKFRHALVAEMDKYLTSPLELKAFSQSLGHSQTITTLQNYGNLSTEKLKETLLGINISQSKQEIINMLEEVLKIARSKK